MVIHIGSRANRWRSASERQRRREGWQAVGLFVVALALAVYGFWRFGI